MQRLADTSANHTEGIGNGSRAAIHCIILASGRQCSINQHLLSDHITGTLSKSKDICLVLGFLWCNVTCLIGMDINLSSLIQDGNPELRMTLRRSYRHKFERY